MPSAAERRPPVIRRGPGAAASALIARRAASAAAAVVLFCGCAARAPHPAAVVPARAGGAEVTRLSRAMRERGRALQSLRAGVVMEYSTDGGARVKARENLIARRPASLRIEALSPFGVALVVAANGARLQIFEPSNHTFMSGAANAATLGRFARIPLEPGDAVALLMGVAPGVRGNLAPDSAGGDGAMLVLTYRGPGDSTRELGFENGELALVRERTGGGATSYEVHYADYRDIGGVMFAYRVDADFPAGRTHVRLRYIRPIINGAVPDSVFVLTPGPGVKRIDIGTAGAAGAGGGE